MRPGANLRAHRQVTGEEISYRALGLVRIRVLEIATDADPLDIYRVLRTTNPSPYMYLLNLEEFSIVGCSPESLVTVRDGKVTTHPIAGTRPRGANAEEDLRIGKELLADPKERSEHVMLVDLGRNDLGRVCTYGSVEVED